MIHPCPKPGKKKNNKVEFKWQEAEAMWKEREMFGCELNLPGKTKEDSCTGNNKDFLENAHRHKRNWYLGKGNLIQAYEQIVLACHNCHVKIEKDKHLTAELFLQLRGVE